MAKAKAKTVDVALEATAELTKAFNPENPRDHFEPDIKSTALSLLEAGWAEIGISRQRDGYLLGGHGRVLGAEWLSQQELEWFEHQWEKWIDRYPDRKDVAEQNRDRFVPQYWLQCPVNYVDLDPLTQKATMVRLNNQNTDGKNNPKRIASILAQLDKTGQQQAGWDHKTAESFMSAFMDRKAAAPAEPESDFQARQYFERKDATDYSGSEDGSPKDATDQSGEVTTSYADPNAEPVTWGTTNFVTGDGTVIEIAEVKEMDANFGAGSFDFTKQYSETRAILYLSQDEYAEYKKLVILCAQIYEVDTDNQIAKIWRSQAVMAGLRALITLSGRSIDEMAVLDPDSEEDSDE